MDIIERRELESMPFDYWDDDTHEYYHATGYEVLIETDFGREWWNEYIDSDGEYYYGR